MPELKNLSIHALRPGRYQPRQNFIEADLQELADSIKSSGLIQPIVVRPIAQDNFEIVAGERRWRASQLAGLTTINCLIHHYSDEQAAAVATIENVNRVDLNAIEEAEAYQRLYQEFAYSQEEIAAVVGKSRAKVTNILRLLKLDARVQNLLRHKILSEGHGKLIAGLAPFQQFPFAEKCVKKAWSVRQAEQEIKKLNNHPADKTQQDVNVKALAHALSDHIGCSVELNFQMGKCQMKIDCHSLEILQGVFDKLGFKSDALS